MKFVVSVYIYIYIYIKVQTEDPKKKKNVTTVATVPPGSVATIQN